MRKQYLILIILIISSISTYATLITSDQKMVYWNIEKTGVEAMLNVTIVNEDNEHIEICIEKPSSQTLNQIKTQYTTKELKEFPIELTSGLTENQDIFISAKSLDLSTEDNKYCLTVSWTKTPLNTQIKLGKNSVIVAAQGGMESAAHQLGMQEDGTIYFCYCDSDNDPGVAYSTDQGDTWNDGYDYTTSARYAKCIPDPSGNIFVSFQYDTTYDTVGYAIVNRTTSSSQSTSFISETSSSQTNIKCHLKADDEIACSSYGSTTYDTQYREYNNAKQELHLDATSIRQTSDIYGCTIITYVDRPSGRNMVYRVCDDVKGTNYTITTNFLNYPEPISMSNGTIFVYGFEGTSGSGRTTTIYQSNNNGTTWVNKTSPLLATYVAIPVNHIGRDIYDNLYVFYLNNQRLNIAYSTDFASTWTKVNTTFTAAYYSVQGAEVSYPNFDLISNPVKLVVTNSTSTNVYFKTIDVLPAPVVSISVALPSSGCSNGKGCSTGGCTACTYCHLNTTKNTISNVNCNGQTTGTPFWTITNDGDGDINVFMELNASSPSGITTKIDDDNNPTGASNLNASQTQICSSIAPAASCQVWEWADFVSLGTATYIRKQFSNATAS